MPEAREIIVHRERQEACSRSSPPSGCRCAWKAARRRCPPPGRVRILRTGRPECFQQQDWRGRIVRWSSPRSTSETPMSASSMALQKKNAGVPSERRIMKSPMSLVANICRPRTLSSNSTDWPSARGNAGSRRPQLGRAASLQASIGNSAPRSARRRQRRSRSCARFRARVRCRSTDRRHRRLEVD